MSLWTREPVASMPGKVTRECSDTQQCCDKAGCGDIIPAGSPSYTWTVFRRGSQTKRRRCLKHYPLCTELPGYAIPKRRGADGQIVVGNY
jgi:hypothetical protein